MTDHEMAMRDIDEAIHSLKCALDSSFETQVWTGLAAAREHLLDAKRMQQKYLEDERQLAAKPKPSSTKKTHRVKVRAI